MNREEIEEWAPCGHEGCAQRNKETDAMAKMLGIEIHGDMYVATDPEAAIMMIRYFATGENFAKDLIDQLEEMANRGHDVDRQMERVRYLEGELATTIKGGRVEARKVGRRSFWEWVKSCLSRSRS